MNIATNKPQSELLINKRMLPQVEILQIMNAYRLSQNILVAAPLGIADLLPDRPWGVV